MSKGTVIKQDPPAGTKGLEGDNVTFWVSKGVRIRHVLTPISSGSNDYFKSV